ncbi:MAG: DsrE family protein [Natronospirillum sp.]
MANLTEHAPTTCDLCLLITQPPQAGVLGQETFELAVAGGVFDQAITVIFSGAAVLHLLPQDPATGYRNTGKLWQSATLFGIEQFLVVAPQPQDFADRLPDNVRTAVQVITAEDARSIMTEAREVMVL